eukprot:TRINITY_DN40753_c0_g1_i1.p1 TRINITY_DN40753_c0_g1~~TRINITY_DN40753_c0_g1_i1.p1  ORF type:complete len:528 (+),score=103.05 TRINITY_DN40753_c0_g1_i1:102-1685(+)
MRRQLALKDALSDGDVVPSADPVDDRAWVALDGRQRGFGGRSAHSASSFLFWKKGLLYNGTPAAKPPEPPWNAHGPANVPVGEPVEPYQKFGATSILGVFGKAIGAAGKLAGKAALAAGAVGVGAAGVLGAKVLGKAVGAKALAGKAAGGLGKVAGGAAKGLIKGGGKALKGLGSAAKGLAGFTGKALQNDEAVTLALLGALSAIAAAALAKRSGHGVLGEPASVKCGPGAKAIPGVVCGSQLARRPQATGGAQRSNTFASLAYKYSKAADRAREEAERYGAEAALHSEQAMAARAQAEAALVQERLMARSSHALADSSLRPFFGYCDKLRDYYSSLEGDSAWMKKDPAMVQLRKFCAGLEYSVGQAVEGGANANDYAKSGLTMYDVPPQEYRLDKEPTWAREVPAFHAASGSQPPPLPQDANAATGEGGDSAAAAGPAAVASQPTTATTAARVEQARPKRLLEAGWDAVPVATGAAYAWALSGFGPRRSNPRPEDAPSERNRLVNRRFATDFLSIGVQRCRGSEFL